MTRSEFLTLAGRLYDAEHGTGTTPATGSAPSPKYDVRLRVKDGYSRASECTLDSLRWFLNRAREGAERGDQYQERSAKESTALERWVAWREQNPQAAWTGTSGDATVTVPAPSGRAPVHAWEQQRKPAPRHDPEPESDNYSDGAEADAEAAAGAFDESDPF